MLSLPSVRRAKRETESEVFGLVMSSNNWSTNGSVALLSAAEISVAAHFANDWKA